MSQPFSFSPADPAFVADPYPVYARGRAECPVLRHAGLPMLSLFRYDDIVSVLRDPGLWSSRIPDPRRAERDSGDSLLGLDPPEHCLLYTSDAADE